MDLQRRGLLIVALGVGAFSCTAARNDSVRYRIKVYVRTRDGISVGSSAFKSIYPHPLNVPGANENVNAHAWGEAIVVDVEGRGQIFGLLGNLAGPSADHAFSPWARGTVTQLLPHALPRDVEDYDNGAIYRYARNNLRGELDLPRSSWPMFVHFGDTADLKSVRFVPLPNTRYREGWGAPVTEFNALLGNDAALERVTLEITNDLVTSNIERILPWVWNMKGAWPGSYMVSRDYPFWQNLLHKNFKTSGGNGGSG